MKRLAALLFLFTLPLGWGFADVLYYRSNSFGMLLDRIASYRRDESEWVMSVATNGPVEVRRLFDNGKEAHRWERSVTSDGSQTVEREYVGALLTARRVYDHAGDLIQEEQYAGGVMTQKTLSTFTAGRLVRSRTLDATGTLLYTDEYLYATNGSLREARRTGAAGVVDTSSFVSGRSGIAEERVVAGDLLIVSRYDTRGRITSTEKRSGKDTISREDFEFHLDSDLLASSTVKLPREGTTIDRRYDDGGLLTTETTTTKSGSVQTVTYTHDDKGRVVGKLSRGPNGLEQWRYVLTDDGTVTREEYSRRGQLEKVTIYGADKLRTEEYYQYGDLFLKVMYDGDTRLKEEVWSDGALVRTKSYP